MHLAVQIHAALAPIMGLAAAVAVALVTEDGHGTRARGLARDMRGGLAQGSSANTASRLGAVMPRSNQS